MCCNRLIVECYPLLIEPWDRHVNIKYGASVDLFEYLHKYLFKGPDMASYDITMEPRVGDKIAEQPCGIIYAPPNALGACLVTMRTSGRHMSSLFSSIVAITIRSCTERWPNNSGGLVSPLESYFHRPGTPCCESLKCNEYFENYMVSAICPLALQLAPP